MAQIGKKSASWGLALILTLNITAQNTTIDYLSGTGSDNTVNWDFYCTSGRNSGQWTKIAVPSCWEQQGFGNYNYGYDAADKRFTEQGLYKKTFEVPAQQKGNTIYIVFEGCMTDAEVKINGKLAGPIHQGAFYRFKYDVSKLLNYGKSNLLEVKVSKSSANNSINLAERHADYWVFGGIFRPVYLEIVPQSHIVKTAIDADMRGNFSADVLLSANNSADEVQLQLYDGQNHQVGKTITAKTVKGINKISLKTQITSPNLWTPETPSLYRAEFTLYKQGKTLHKTSEKIGFRSIDIVARDGVYLNGTKIKFKGVNRHSFWPTSGRTTSRQISINDVNLMKDMNMNAVRNSHYPAEKHFYEVCDSLGLLVLDELAGWHDAYDTTTGTKLVAEMMDVSRNHPSVVMWVNGNEGGHNHDLVPVFQANDIQKRPVIHAWEIFNNADTQHYRDYNYGVGNHFQGREVVFPTEFLHGVYDGGHGAGLDDFWKAMWDNPLSAGGFLWNLADEGVLRPDRNNEIDTDGNHGADGIVGPYHEKEASFYTIKEIWSPVQFEKKQITDRFDGSLVIENRYHFTNTSECRFTWQLKKTKAPWGNPANEQVANGTAPAPSITPLQKGILKIELPKDWTDYDVLYVTVFDNTNRELFTWSWPIASPKKIANNLVDTKGNIAPRVTETANTITVSAADITLAFDKTNGLLKSVENTKGTMPLTNGPVLCDGIAIPISCTQKTENNNVIIETTYSDKSNLTVLKWTIYPSGWVRMDVSYCPVGEQHVLLGINFDCPESNIKGMKWLGDGPYRVWKNRTKGNALDVWSKSYNNTVTGQFPFEYPEFKGYHSNMYWLTVNTNSQPFTVVTPDEDLYFRMLTPEFPKAPFNTDPPFPAGDISFMHGISAMGTKQFTPERMGPMSQKNIYYHYERQRPLKMVLYFDFGSKKEN